jgi:hypothetical protein
MKKTFKSFSLIINYKTFLITALSVLSAYLCFTNGLTAKFPDMLVGVAIVFPVVFSIGSAFTRRETALQRYADFKGHIIAIYYAMRDWSTPDKENKLPQRLRNLVYEIMSLSREMFKGQRGEAWEKNEKKMYELFSQLSSLTMEMRNHGVQSGEISRVSQYVSKLIIAFDNMKIIHHYRTPITLRAYSKVFIYIFPIIYGPYFASTFHDFSAHLEYVMPVLYSFILVENPFDDVGEDDIVIDPEEVKEILH